jgi:hypothetical protein
MSYSCKQRCENLIISLKVVGKLSGEDKLIFRHRDVIIQKPYYWTGTIRYLFGDSRKETITGLRVTLDEVESIINDCTKMDNNGLSDTDKYLMMKRLGKSLKSTIGSSGLGISSLMLLYNEDPVAVANLESIAERARLLEKELMKKTESFKGGIEYNSSSDGYVSTGE